MEQLNVDTLTRTALAKLTKEEIAMHVLKIKVDGIVFDSAPEEVYVSNDEILDVAKYGHGLDIEDTEMLEVLSEGV